MDCDLMMSMETDRLKNGILVSAGYLQIEYRIVQNVQYVQYVQNVKYLQYVEYAGYAQYVEYV
jgi:hypothetical protein